MFVETKLRPLAVLIAGVLGAYGCVPDEPSAPPPHMAGPCQNAGPGNEFTERMDGFPDWSPSRGGEIVYERTAVTWEDVAARGTWQIWTINLATGEQRYITRGSSPKWSPTGEQFSYNRQMAGGTFQILLFDLASETITQLTDGPGQKRSSDWSPDGMSLVFTKSGADGGLWRVDRTTGALTFVTRTIYQWVSWSPTSDLVAGGPGIRLVDLSAPDSIDVVISDAASDPSLSPDGRSIGYRDLQIPGRTATSVKDLKTREGRRLVEYGREMAFSPDGESFVYSALDSASNVTVLYVARLDGTDCYQLTRLEDYALPDSTGK